MPANSFGKHFVVTTFGESHGTALGVVIDGCPSQVLWDQKLIEFNLSRRRPGQNATVSARQESDHFEVLSGIYEGQTLGTPISMIVRNSDAKSKDYDVIRNNPRAGHADDVWKNKFGISDPRGGGRSSGRETVARVLAGSVAQMFLKKVCPILFVSVRVTEIFDQKVSGPPYEPAIEKLLSEAKAQGESYGGLIQVRIENPPANLGQPVFHKLKSDFAAAFMGIGAINSVELGSSDISTKGSEYHNNSTSSKYGGIRGGISTGETIEFNLKIKPTSSILDVAKLGRHDPFIGTRAVPVVESMAYLVLADHYLWNQSQKN